MLIVLQDAELERTVAVTAARIPALDRREVHFQVLTGELNQALPNLLERVPTVPVGFVARDEASVLDALAAGVDEAAAFDATDPTALIAFIDRTEARARRRLEAADVRQRLAHTEKLATLGTLVAGVGHEINNPLSAIMLSIAATQRHLLPAFDAALTVLQAQREGRPIDPVMAARIDAVPWTRLRRDAVSVLDDISASAASIASIVRELRVFARADSDELPEIVEVPELIDHVLRLLGRDLSNRGIIIRDYAPGLPSLVLPRSRLTQVLTNLLVNAAQAIAEVDRPVHRVEISVRADDEFLAIAISDTGPGIGPDAVARIFDPFYTTKRKELGTGLGLSISRSILRKLGGDLMAESVFGEGATFLCLLPRPTPQHLQLARESVAPTVGYSEADMGRAVLIVDDDPRVQRAYGRLLNPVHRLLVASDAAEAIELLTSESKPDALVLEIDLPARDGIRLMAWLVQNRPDLLGRTLIVTGPDAAARHGRLLDAHPGRVLFKPLRGEALLDALAELLGSGQAAVG